MRSVISDKKNPINIVYSDSDMIVQKQNST